MRLLIRLVLVTGLIAGTAFADDRKATVQPTSSREGFTTLFNGKDFTGWHGLKTMDPRQFEALSAEEKSKVLAEGAEDMKKHWKVRGRRHRQRRPGCLSHHRQGLRRHRAPGRLEDRTARAIAASTSAARRRFRSGISPSPDTRRWAPTRAPAVSGTTARAHPARIPLVRADNPVGQWNTFRIIQVGARTTIYLNDKLIVDHAILENYWKRSIPIPARGPIQLQTHDHELLWRNISIREIPAEEANRILGKHGSAGLRADLQRPET